MYKKSNEHNMRVLCASPHGVLTARSHWFNNQLFLFLAHIPNKNQEMSSIGVFFADEN